MALPEELITHIYNFVHTQNQKDVLRELPQKVDLFLEYTLSEEDEETWQTQGIPGYFRGTGSDRWERSGEGILGLKPLYETYSTCYTRDVYNVKSRQTVCEVTWPNARQERFMERPWKQTKIVGDVDTNTYNREYVVKTDGYPRDPRQYLVFDSQHETMLYSRERFGEIEGNGIIFRL